MSSRKPLSRRRFLIGGMAGLTLAACNGGSSSSSSPSNNSDGGDIPSPGDNGGTPAPGNDLVENIGVDGPFNPRGLHSSFVTDAHTSRTLTWFTDGTDSPNSYMEFASVSPGMSDDAIILDPFEFSVEASADTTPGVDVLTHRASAEGIDPDLPLRYRVGSDEGGWSPVYIIQPSPRDEWSFIHFGDHGTGSLAQTVTAEIMKTPADLLLIAGDLSYANGDQPIWDTWFAQMEPLLTQRMMLAAPGNHEQKDYDGGTFKNRFTHPAKPLTGNINPDGPGTSFYSFDYNRVHFLVTTAGALVNDGTLLEEILNIEADLAEAAIRRARGEIDFIIVMQHFTIWTDQLDRSPANFTLVALEENILLRYGVDLLIVGHDHIYQRSAPMSLGFANPLGYVQVLVGTGGASIRLFDDNGIQSWSEGDFVGIGFARYRVSGGKIAVEYIGAPPLDMSDEGRQYTTGEFEVRDSFEISRRDTFACYNCAKPARTRSELLALTNFEAMESHTRARNKRALLHCS